MNDKYLLITQLIYLVVFYVVLARGICVSLLHLNKIKIKKNITTFKVKIIIIIINNYTVKSSKSKN